VFSANVGLGIIFNGEGGVSSINVTVVQNYILFVMSVIRR
jgi:hypothetical protein